MVASGRGGTWNAAAVALERQNVFARGSLLLQLGCGRPAEVDEALRAVRQNVFAVSLAIVLAVRFSLDRLLKWNRDPYRASKQRGGHRPLCAGSLALVSPRPA